MRVNGNLMGVLYIRVNNGLTMFTGSYGFIISTININPQTNILDTFGYFQSPSIQRFEYAALSGGTSYFIGNINNNYGVGSENYQGSGSGITDTGVAISPGTPVITSVWGGSTSVYGSINYGKIYSNNTYFTATNSLPIMINVRGDTDNDGVFVTWIRTRSILPNNVMPSVTFSSIQ